MKVLSKLLWAIVIVLLVAVVAAPQAEASFPVTNNSIDEQNSDMAKDSAGNLHVAFERAGNIYYMKRTGTVWDPEELIGSGNSPAIAVDSNNIPHVVYISGGAAIYTNRSGGSWQIGQSVISTVGWVDIDVDGSGYAHIVYSGSICGSRVFDIGYSNNTGGTFQQQFCYGSWFDGWPCYCGEYWFTPLIKVDASGNYYILYRDAHPGSGSGNWAQYVFISNAPGISGSSGPVYNQNNFSIGKNGLAIDNQGNAYVTYYAEGTWRYVEITGGNWVETTLTGSSHSIDVNRVSGEVHIAYVNPTGGIDYITDTGSGFSSPTNIAATGRNPVISAGSSYIIYEAHDGTDYEIYFYTDQPVNLNVFTSGAGTVTSNPAGINCGTDCSETYVQGTTVTLTATPDAGSTFAGWSGDCTDIGNNQAQVTMNADKTCTAAFEPKPDLTGSWTAMTKKIIKSGSSYRGESIKGTLKVENIGNSQVPSGVKILFYLSNDGTSPNKYITVVKTSSPINPNSYINVPFTYYSRSSVTGKYIIAVIDSNNQIDEVSETNNNVTSSQLP